MSLSGIPSGVFSHGIMGKTAQSFKEVFNVSEPMGVRQPGDLGGFSLPICEFLASLLHCYLSFFPFMYLSFSFPILALLCINGVVMYYNTHVNHFGVILLGKAQHKNKCN